MYTIYLSAHLPAYLFSSDVARQREILMAIAICFAYVTCACHLVLDQPSE